MKGLPFRLEIIEADTKWIVSCSSECGEAMIRTPAPYSESELQAALAKVENSLTKSYSKILTRGSTSTERPVREFGERLADTLLRDEILIQFDRCRNLAKAQRKPLRILLRTNGTHVDHIPWEYLVDPSRDDYLALRIPLVRYLRIMNPVPPLPLTLPLRVLGISARPSDLPALEEGRERERIAQVLQRPSSDNVEVHWLSGDRWQDLAKELRSGSWHVLHFVCHGGFDEDRNSGYIHLSGDDGAARPLHANDFERLIADSGNLRLIVLNACESAVSRSEEAFRSTAANLVHAGVPAVVAMQYEITDEAALIFSSAFYEHIADGRPVDRAVTLAREEVKMRLGSLEWATPVLLLASDETQIFDPKPQERQPPGSLRLLAEVGSCSHVALGPSNLLAAACANGVVRIFDGTDGRPVSQCMPVQREEPLRVAWSPWRRHVASRHLDGTVIVWDLQTEVPVRVIGAGGHDDGLAFSANGRWLALTVGDHVHVYDVRGARVRDLPVRPPEEAGPGRPGQPGNLGPIAFAPGDRHVVVACGDGLVRQLDVQGRLVMTWPHPQPVLSLAFTDDLLATGCLDGRVRLWSWEGQLLRRTDHGRPATQLAFSAGVRALAVADDEGVVAIRDLDTWKATIAARLASRPVGLAFLEGGTGLVTGTREGVVESWSLTG
ncbi:CHAT domain-containing WD40 repeat protein [Streptomyces griseochromogenes]|uniref:CHAT domain-containing WD40 repeat protein n=1 Tax=Streptomyces griseochromogenes TaxID=68214 RepID=UPI00378DA031